MADIQSAAAEIRQGKKEEERKKNKRQDENIMVCPIPQGDHNNTICYVDIQDTQNRHNMEGPRCTAAGNCTET